MNFRFNASIYPNGVRIIQQFAIFVHIANQILMAGNFAKLDWPKRTKKKEYAMNFRLQQIEILKDEINDLSLAYPMLQSLTRSF